MKKIILSSLILLSFSCSKQTDTDKIGDAQLCLNSASGSAAVNECLAKIDGIETTGAYGVRCNGAFVREGFASPSKYSTAFSALQGGGSTPTMDFMGFIMFSSATTISENSSNATTAFNQCYTSGAKGTTLIAALGSFATSMYNYMNSTDLSTCKNAGNSCASAPVAGTGLYSLTNCSTCYFSTIATTNLTPGTAMLDPTSANASAVSFQSSVGAIIVSTYNISCASSNANQSLCTTLSTAITAAGGASNTRRVATKLICTIANLNPALCP